LETELAFAMNRQGATSSSLRAERSNPDFGTAGLPRFARNDDEWRT
jgi:hypothetical protein